MKDMMKYKNYDGSVRYSEEDGVLHGKIECIRLKRAIEYEVAI
jgi:hypothetical protein